MTVVKLMMKAILLSLTLCSSTNWIKDSSKHIIDKELKDITDNHNVQIEKLKVAL